MMAALAVVLALGACADVGGADLEIDEEAVAAMRAEIEGVRFLYLADSPDERGMYVRGRRLDPDLDEAYVREWADDELNDAEVDLLMERMRQARDARVSRTPSRRLDDDPKS